MGKCILSGVFHVQAKISGTPETWESVADPGQVVSQEFVLTTNKAGVVSLSAVVSPPAGGVASDVVLQTTSATLKSGANTVSVTFVVAAKALAADYGLQLTVS